MISLIKVEELAEIIWHVIKKLRSQGHSSAMNSRVISGAFVLYIDYLPSFQRLISWKLPASPVYKISVSSSSGYYGFLLIRGIHFLPTLHINFNRAQAVAGSAPHFDKP